MGPFWSIRWETMLQSEHFLFDLYIQSQSR